MKKPFSKGSQEQVDEVLERTMDELFKYMNLSKVISRTMFGICIVWFLGDWLFVRGDLSILEYLDNTESPAKSLWALAFGSTIFSVIYQAIHICIRSWQKKIEASKEGLAIPQVNPGLLFILAVITDGRDREVVLGDASERFVKEAQIYGLRKAQWLFVCDVLRSIGPRILQISKAAFKWLLVGTMMERVYNWMIGK